MISIIVVIGKNKAIGCKNQLLWNLPEDLKRFKKITENHIVIMGDKTFESIGFPLPKRRNVVLSRDKTYQATGCKVEFSFEKILNKYKNSKEEVFIIGGGQIYKQFLPFYLLK
jgi:dihydrofolate reductase